MNRKHNPWVSLTALLLLAVILVMACTGCGAAEGEAQDNYVIVKLPNGEVVAGYSSDWFVYSTGSVKVCIDGTYYKTHIANVARIWGEPPAPLLDCRED